MQVYKRPEVAVLTTGDEIVGIDAAPGPTQIRNSNSYSLAVQIRHAGGEPVLLLIAPDEPRSFSESVARAPPPEKARGPTSSAFPETQSRPW